MRGVSKDRRLRLWPILRGSPRRGGEHLRMTTECVARKKTRVLASTWFVASLLREILFAFHRLGGSYGFRAYDT